MCSFFYFFSCSRSVVVCCRCRFGAYRHAFRCRLYLFLFPFVCFIFFFLPFFVSFFPFFTDRLLVFVCNNYFVASIENVEIMSMCVCLCAQWTRTLLYIWYVYIQKSQCRKNATQNKQEMKQCNKSKAIIKLMTMIHNNVKSTSWAQNITYTLPTNRTTKRIEHQLELDDGGSSSNNNSQVHRDSLGSRFYFWWRKKTSRKYLKALLIEKLYGAQTIHCRKTKTNFFFRSLSLSLALLLTSVVVLYVVFFKCWKIFYEFGMCGILFALLSFDISKGNISEANLDWGAPNSKR